MSSLEQWESLVQKCKDIKEPSFEGVTAIRALNDLRGELGLQVVFSVTTEALNEAVEKVRELKNGK